jgi:hypothetical protein
MCQLLYSCTSLCSDNSVSCSILRLVCWNVTLYSLVDRHQHQNSLLWKCRMSYIVMLDTWQYCNEIYECFRSVPADKYTGYGQFNSIQFNSTYFALIWSIVVMTHQIWKLSIQKIRLQIYTYIHLYIHTNNIHDVRYNTVNFSLFLDRQHSDCIVTVKSYISYGV